MFQTDCSLFHGWARNSPGRWTVGGSKELKLKLKISGPDMSCFSQGGADKTNLEVWQAQFWVKFSNCWLTRPKNSLNKHRESLKPTIARFNQQHKDDTIPCTQATPTVGWSRPSPPRFALQPGQNKLWIHRLRRCFVAETVSDIHRSIELVKNCLQIFGHAKLLTYGTLTILRKSSQFWILPKNKIKRTHQDFPTVSITQVCSTLVAQHRFLCILRYG